MAYDPQLAERVRAITVGAGVTEKHMFGGIAFMKNDRMAFGIVRDELMVRVGPAHYEASLQRPHVKPMDFTGRPLRGMVFVAPEGIRTRAALQKWIELAIAVADAEPPKKPKMKKKPARRRQ